MFGNQAVDCGSQTKLSGELLNVQAKQREALDIQAMKNDPNNIKAMTDLSDYDFFQAGTYHH